MSKIDAENEILKNAPTILDYLNDSSKERFDKVKHYLELMDIDYEVNPKIVRGLDYYNHTVFEIEATVKDFGAQNVLAGGGRYNKMVEMLDGPSTPAIGFACGLDRLMLAIEKEDIELNIFNQIDCFLMYVSDTEKDMAVKIVNDLRSNGIICDMENMGRSLKAQFKQADRLNSKFLLLLNDKDLENNVVTIKDNVTKEEQKINIDELLDYLNVNI